jgi:hypothetical protein
VEKLIALARQRADNSHALLGCSQEDLGAGISG